MTDAERKLIDAMLGAGDLHIRTSGTTTVNIGAALADVALERVPPEAKEKFVALHQRERMARKELQDFCDTLPKLVVEKWWGENQG